MPSLPIRTTIGPAAPALADRALKRGERRTAELQCLAWHGHPGHEHHGQDARAWSFYISDMHSAAPRTMVLAYMVNVIFVGGDLLCLSVPLLSPTAMDLVPRFNRKRSVARTGLSRAKSAVDFES